MNIAQQIIITDEPEVFMTTLIGHHNQMMTIVLNPNVVSLLIHDIRDLQHKDITVPVMALVEWGNTTLYKNGYTYDNPITSAQGSKCAGGTMVVSDSTFHLAVFYGNGFLVNIIVPEATRKMVLEKISLDKLIGLSEEEVNRIIDQFNDEIIKDHGSNN
jgi:hypothetical protein